MDLTITPLKDFFCIPPVFWGIPISAVGLKVRTENWLIANDIKTLGDLAQLSYSELRKFKNFGRKSLDDLQKKLPEVKPPRLAYYLVESYGITQAIADINKLAWAGWKVHDWKVLPGKEYEEPLYVTLMISPDQKEFPLPDEGGIAP